ncbi:MAG: NAD(P)H-hydrate dehydratase [Clostridia bacterium]|nr:NAD(P)H-hydrate dehydratase [Clostridia bacterium]
MNNISEFSYTEADLASLPPRPTRSNKGSFGRVLCVCGSYGMAGAAYLCALGAYRTGAGLVEIFVPEENRIILQTLLPEAVLTVYDKNTPDTDLLQERLTACDAAVVGSGLGKSKTSLTLLKAVLKNTKVPTVIDADALNLIAEHPFLLKYAKGHIVTPHAGEMSRLTGLSIDEILNNTKSVAHQFAESNSLICVLKDHNTVVSDGTDKIYLNRSGNSGMATGGSGDVLAGVIASLLAQRHLSLSPFEAAAFGVYIHGLAGDRTAKSLGEYAVMATDIANNIKI